RRHLRPDAGRPPTAHEGSCCPSSRSRLESRRTEFLRTTRAVVDRMRTRRAPDQKVTMYAMSAQGRIVHSPTRDCRRASVKCSDRNPPSVIRYSADSCTTVCPKRRYHSRLAATEASAKTDSSLVPG